MSEQNEELKFTVTEPVTTSIATQQPAALEPMSIVDGVEIKTSTDLARTAKMLLKSGMLPSRFDSEAKVIGGLQYALELGFKPLSGLKNIAIVNGSPMIFAEAPLALVLRSGQLEFIVEHYLDKDQNKICMENKNLNSEVWASVTITKRKGCAELCETFFTLDDMNKAGIQLFDKYGKETVWSKYTKFMLRYRARAANLKSMFADCLFNCAIAEYDSNDGFFESPSKNKVIDNDKLLIDESILAEINTKPSQEIR